MAVNENPEADTLGLGMVFGLLRRRALLIVAVAILSLAAASLYLLSLQPLYTTSALVLVDPTKKDLLEQDSAPLTSADSARVDSEVQLVVSNTTLAKAASTLRLVEDPDFGVTLGFRERLLTLFRLVDPAPVTGEEAFYGVLDRMWKSVSASRIGSTFIIAVSATTPRPDLSASIANEVARAYTEVQFQAKIDAVLRARDTISARISEAAVSVARTEESFDQFVDENLESISKQTGRPDLLSIKSQISLQSSLRAEAGRTVEAAELSLADNDYESLANTLKSEALTRLEAQRRDLLKSIEVANEGATAVNLRDQLSAVEEDLRSQASESITGLRGQVSQAQTKVSELRADLRSAVMTSDLPADILTSIYKLQKDSEISRDLYQRLLTRQNDLDTQAYIQLPDSRIVQEAGAVNTPSFPKPLSILTLSGAFGLGLGISIAFLLENFFGGFSSEGQLAGLLRVPVVGSVPAERTRRSKQGVPQSSIADLVVDSPLSAYGEAIRRTKLAADRAVSRSEPRPGNVEKVGTSQVVMVTSTLAGEGKTTMALSLARAYSASAKSVILIDCDLRRPGVHKQVGMDTSDGLLEYLADNDSKDIRDFIRKDPLSEVRIVLGSRSSEVVTEQLIASDALATLIAAAKRSFDVVILDTPPIGLVIDGLYASRYADVVVFVVKWSGPSQQQVRAALHSLSEEGERFPVLSVLNQVRGGRFKFRQSDYYYYGKA